jgi:D-aminopeptidase
MWHMCLRLRGDAAFRCSAAGNVSLAALIGSAAAAGQPRGVAAARQQGRAAVHRFVRQAAGAAAGEQLFAWLLLGEYRGPDV